MLAKKKTPDTQALKDALDEFLAMERDEGTVHRVEQRLELHLFGTTAYLPAYTKRTMDQNHGAPVMAIHTKTSKKTNRVFLYAAADLKHPDARKLRIDETMGPAHFAFGVPLKMLGMKFPETRRITLPLTTVESEEHGTVYWASLADLESERRDIKPADKPAAAE